MMIGLLKPTSGKILIDGRDITKMPETELNEQRKHMGMVFQYSALFDSMNVKENIAFGLRMHTKLSEPEIDQAVKEKNFIWWDLMEQKNLCRQTCPGA